MRIEINTNLTYINQSMLQNLCFFKEVLLSPSIDAYGDKNDWIRSPSRFSKIEKNMKRNFKASGKYKNSYKLHSQRF